MHLLFINYYDCFDRKNYRIFLFNLVKLYSDKHDEHVSRTRQTKPTLQGALPLYVKVDVAQLIGKLTEGKAKGVTRILTNRYSDWG